MATPGISSIPDLKWYERFDEALAAAAAAQRILLAKPIGQGLVIRDGIEYWAPGPNYTRAVVLSDPALLTMIHEHFVAARFSLQRVGAGVDAEGQKAIREHEYCSPPGLAAFTPDGELIDQTQHTDDLEGTRKFLEALLSRYPKLAAGWTPDRDYSPYDRSDPQQARLLEIETCIPQASREAQAELAKELESLVAAFETDRPDAAALAGILLGDSRFHLGEFKSAGEAWSQVVDVFPLHPLSHRARHNLLDKNTYPTAWHPSLQSAPARPSIVDCPPAVPDESRRAANLAAVHNGAGYEMLADGLPFVRVPAGTFTMGGSPARLHCELPVRSVTISKPYWISAWPITRADWLRFKPEAWSGADREGLALELPAGSVSYTDALDFAAFLGEQIGMRLRLPTEAEWEYAARGGLDGAEYPWGDDPIDATRANTDRGHLTPVACYAPNGYGLFDVVGNTAEWTADTFHYDAYSRTDADVTDPLVTGESLPDPLAPAGAKPSIRRVMRASFSGNLFLDEMARNSFRHGIDEFVRAPGLSFRLVAEIDDQIPTETMESRAR